MVEVNRNDDLMLGFREMRTAETLSETGKIIVHTEMLGELILPTGPLVPHGIINYKRYLVRAAITPGIPQAYITKKLSQRYKLREVEVPTYMRNGEAKPIQHGGIECYIEFDSLEAALKMPGYIEVDGVEVRL